jgi:hypothetical protein
MPGRGGGPSFAEAVREAIARWDLDHDAQASIVVEVPQELGYAALQSVAAEIVAYHDAWFIVGGAVAFVSVRVPASDWALCSRERYGALNHSG